MRDVMIDLETMGTKSKSLIVSIGAVFFDINTGEQGETFHQFIEMQDSIDCGLVVTGDTFKWWLQRNDDARYKLVEGLDDAAPLRQVLHNFIGFITSNIEIDDIRPWGNGASFDISLLEDAYEQIMVPAPWRFYNVMDCRTMEMAASHLVTRKSIPRQGTHHSALDDAKYQATYISAMYQAVKNTSIGRKV